MTACDDDTVESIVAGDIIHAWYVDNLNVVNGRNVRLLWNKKRPYFLPVHTKLVYVVFLMA